jgi:probable phosphoglycerate mutase
MKKILYLMRHGETLFNVQHKIQGYCDSPLTELGIEQAKRVAHYFKDIHLDYAYCSTSERASDTLELVTKNKIPYTRVKGLKERNFGMFEGEREAIHLKKHFDTIYGEYGGETTVQVSDRVVKTITDIMKKENHNSVLMVSHSGSIRIFSLNYVSEERFGTMQMPNCCILKFEVEDDTFTLLDIIDPKDIVVEEAL